MELSLVRYLYEVSKGGMFDIDADAHIKVYSFLESCSENELRYLFESRILNDFYLNTLHETLENYCIGNKNDREYIETAFEDALIRKQPY